MTKGLDPDSGEASLEAWRRKAIDVYALVLAIVQGLGQAFATWTSRLSRLEELGVLVGWLFVAAAAALRSMSPRWRVMLLLLAVWIYSATMLSRGGIFLDARPTLLVSPLVFLALAGVRDGLAVAVINTLFFIGALKATAMGWLPRAPPTWRPGEWRFQAVLVVVNGLPPLVLFVAFTQHLIKSLQRESITAMRLRAEAADRARLEGELLEAGERESQRIGSDLHDGVCQDLAGLLLRAKRTQKELDLHSRPEAASLRELVEGLGEAIGEVHGLSQRLSPGRLTGNDLAGALGDLVRRIAEVADAGIAFRYRSNGALPSGSPATMLHLFRIAQEGIANAVRHSNASQINIELEQTADLTRLMIDDDGRGLSPDATSGGLGLKTMRWRARMIGGDLAVGPRPGGGTRVQCQVPAETPQREVVAHG